MVELGVWGTTVLPLLGNFLGLLMFFSPWKTVQQVRITQEQGAVNGLPFVMIYMQCITWVMYAFFKNNFMLFPVNYVGAIIGLYYSLVFYSASKTIPQRFRFEMLFLVATAVPGGLATICFFLVPGNDARQLTMGIACNAFCIMMYGSPLSTFAHIIRTKDSSSLTAPLSVCAFINGVVWTAYGFLIRDIFVYLPNVCATVLGAIQLVLLLIYPRKNAVKEASSQDKQPFLSSNDSEVATNGSANA